jgi:hypothetical protein
VEEEEEKCRRSPGAIEPSIGPSCATAIFFCYIMLFAVQFGVLHADANYNTINATTCNAALWSEELINRLPFHC